MGTAAFVTTNVYFSYFDRDWWRQSSSTTDTQIGASALANRLAGNPIDADTIRSVQGRLREYTTWGLEPRLRSSFQAAGARHELQAGLKGHFERQDRKQLNGTSPTARTGTLVEDNLRNTQAYSAFVADRLAWGAWSVTPGLRYEYIHSRRENRLPGGLAGADNLGKLIPSLGAAWNPSSALTVFGGVHQGFAPPRTEDIISATGTSTDVGPEESVNWELGARFAPGASGELQATLFRNDFQRLIAVGSIAAGSTPLAQGEARFAGAELSGRYRHATGAYVRGAYTWVPEAEQTTAFRQVVNGAVIAGSAPGRRQPYSPEHLLTAAAGYAWRGLDAALEAVHVGRQFADFANTVLPTADGQRGELAAQTIWNATVNQDIGAT
ncbi:MAG TPA: TonB-dependent receptor, partial [Methylomirabilota bacterium]|nr:TonB-dependent receptor [Methylomirabilota bacterium]